MVSSIAKQTEEFQLNLFLKTENTVLKPWKELYRKMVLALITIHKAQKQWNNQNGKAACYITRVKMFLSTAWNKKNKPTHLFGASEFKWAGFHEI